MRADRRQPAASARASHRARRFEQVAILAAGLVAGAGVLIAGWPPMLVLALFWVENLVVAAGQALRILLVGARDGWPGLFGCGVVVLIFAAWTGLFSLGHAAMIVGVVGDAAAQAHGAIPESGLFLAGQVYEAAEARPLLGLMLLVASLDLLRWRFASHADPELEDIGSLMKEGRGRANVRASGRAALRRLRA